MSHLRIEINGILRRKISISSEKSALLKKKTPKKIILNISRKTTVKAYREILSSQIRKLSGLDDNDVLEIDVEEKG